MLDQLKTLLRRADFYLRNKPYRSPSEDCVCRPIDELFDRPPDPLRTRVYWFVRRWAKNVWDAPSDAYRAAKYACQRVTRGWDDRAVWSIDWWLDERMPAMLRKLKEDKHGVPMEMFDGLPVNDKGYHDDAEFAIAEGRWNAILDKMIAAFEASRRINHGLYEEELGEYPLRRPEGVSKEAWKKVRDDRFKASQLFQERDEKIFKEGMALFVEFYSNLWD